MKYNTLNRHRTLIKHPTAKTDLEILDQLELDELIAFADSHNIDIREEKKIDQQAILDKVMADPWVQKVRKEHNLC